VLLVLLQFNSITTLEPLSSLVHLQTLNISHNQLKNLNGLQSLTSKREPNIDPHTLALLPGVP
jgi:Leucine-rich repeat (LRR) protein